ncbi:hypothetical protein NR458_02880 [Pediococcus ethanolidurans]|uniref:hypothetical protein n=1 Tax=Pediococcus ethanolidurans TaxID=319653 RepID=UPI001C1EC5AB|nr:hypothetical protein [Pediococcus ethanolidurans]MBU7554591.1 hypothetical protein [Pediococcus ethanolidurans]MBU7563339.1 hypothetical protein [Pediococcus ethanolidurans]MCV3323244.1 hypothetical protein [Pediococcus ethanolidurans]MCV3554889.1 hypothetical protein [Pediococcus ethanolidurans]
MRCEKKLMLVVLSMAAMCLFNSPIRGDTHVSEGLVGFSKPVAQHNVSDKPIYSKVEPNRQAYLPQTDEQDGVWMSVMGMTGVVVIVGYEIKKRLIR